MKSNILDKNTHKDWGQYVFEDSEIKWKESPKYRLVFRFLEHDFHFDAMTGATSPVIIYGAFLLFFLYSLFHTDHYFWGILFGIIGISLPFAFEYFRCKNLSKSAYAITEKYVLFKFFNGFSYKIHAINIEDILKIHLITGQKGNVSILFETYKNIPFTTYNHENGNRRNLPSFESIENADEAVNILKSLIKPKKRKKEGYKYPMVSGGKLNWTKIIFKILVGIMLLYSIDYYILPKKTISDFGKSSQAVIVDSREIGGIAKTQKGFSIRTSDFLPELGQDSVELTFSYTPIFKTIKKLKTERKDYSSRLSGMLQSPITAISFLICLLSGIVGLFLMKDKTEILAETHMKIVVFFTFFFIFYLYVWNLGN